MGSLNVWMNGEWVAVWTVNRGVHKLSYTAQWLQSERRRSLSLSLAITPDRSISGDRVRNYFDNLLPDNEQIRERVRRRYGLARADVFDLLSAIGRDCVGAVQLLPEHAEPSGFDRIQGQALNEAGVARILRSVPSDRALGGPRDDHDFRISIAGAQEKTAFLRYRGRWMVPAGATPTTHIFKLPMGVVGGLRRIDHLESIDNEWLCLRLLQAMGLPAAHAELAAFEDQRVLVVERFDRANQGTWIARLPQEDFCQATATPPGMKYEADGGPGIDKCLQLLAGAVEPAVDRAVFVLAQFAFWMLAAIDGHAKNFSIFLAAGDRYALTPLYDVLSAYPGMGNSPAQIRWHDMKLAMGVKSKNKHYLLKEILPRHWKQLAQKSGEPGLEFAMTELAQAVPRAIEQVGRQLPAGFPMRVFETISAGLRKQANAFLRAGSSSR